MLRAYYYDDIKDFVEKSPETILGIMVKSNEFSLDDLQRNSWLEEIILLQQELNRLEGTIIFEYTVPRIGSRIDCVLIHRGLLFLLEFKVGATDYSKYGIDQVTDYALDLQNFHQESHNRFLIPMLVATKAKDVPLKSSWQKEGIHEVLLCNATNIRDTINFVANQYIVSPIISDNWLKSPYKPTPTIIEAAQALYRSHNVREISRNDAGAYNLDLTTQAIDKVIDESKREHKKSICFITGVPGAGKTLAGLNIANSRQRFQDDEHAVFLSGNQPLVAVLQEALARDDCRRKRLSKSIALREARSFIQIIHHFRDNVLENEIPPNEKVAIFDEAQRAWEAEHLKKFMARKKGKPNFDISEPDFLISVMDRHDDWAVIVCLIGGGQEINNGEAGISEWFHALRKNYPQWNVYVSDRITDSEYTRGMEISELLMDLNYQFISELHLAVSLRSFRSEKVSEFVKAILDVDIQRAIKLHQRIKNHYPIAITRNLQEAKQWVREQAKGTERYGIIASSGAKRLRSFGIWVQSKIDAPHWFLNDQDDVRSCCFLEEAATEFDIQGLELDWTIVCWDANLRFNNGHWCYFNFNGSRWKNIYQENTKNYLINAYRVLLTRARQGMIIFIPEGDPKDQTRLPEYYDNTYHYLRSLLG